MDLHGRVQNITPEPQNRQCQSSSRNDINEERGADAHEEVEHEVEECLLQPKTFTERDDSLLEADGEHRRAGRQCEPRTSPLEEEPRYRTEHCQSDMTYSSQQPTKGNADGEWTFYSPHTPPEKAMSTLKALVLFSVLSSDLSPLRMPTMIARTTISPAEHTAKDTLDILFRSSDS